jgi:hypothetical protein
MELAFGTAVGCLLGLAFIPLFNFYYKMNRGVKNG